MSLLAISLILSGLLYRLYTVLPKERQRTQASLCVSESNLAVFLGSGGHTSEALALVSSLDFSYYRKRTYIISEGDHLSAEKASRLEESRPSLQGSYLIITVPRARRVHQPLYTTPLSAAISILSCVYYMNLVPILGITGPCILADVLLLNGPGTCLSLCLAAYVNRFVGLPSPKLIYVESFARVHRLSLSGRLLRRLVDRFLVQWPQVSKSNHDYHGWLV